MEVDLLEFDDWNENYSWSNFSPENIENQILSKLTSDDYFIKKQTLSEALIYLQNPKSSESVRSILDAIKGISGDYESSLRSDLAESLVTIHRLCDNVEQLNNENWSFLRNFVIPVITVFLHDSNKQVRLASHSAILQFIQENLINKDLFEEHFLESLKELMNYCNPDELRSECFALLVQLSSILNNCFENELIEYSNDFIRTNDTLRKTCASYLCNIIKNSSKEHLKDWLDVFYKLAEDNSWYVRKFCIESACCLSRQISHEERWNKMADTYYSFMTDSKKWVFTSSLQNIGEFITTFADPSKTNCHFENGRIINTNPPSTTSSIKDKRTSNRTVDMNSVYNKLNENIETASDFSTFSYWRAPVDTNQFPCELIDAMSSLKLTNDNCGDTNGEPTFNDISSKKQVVPNQNIVPEKLITCYINTIEENRDIDVLKPCAFSMPAVLYTLGPSCWPYMGRVYFLLLQCMSWKVRLSLASSIHHVFEIFRNNTQAVNDLITVYKELIKDVDEIKVGLMENVSSFFLALPISRYPEVFDDICDLLQLESVKNWRYRVSGMEQLGRVVKELKLNCDEDWQVFIPIFRNRWVPTVFQYVNDSVYAVRMSAVQVILQMLQRIENWCKTYNSNDKLIESRHNQLQKIELEILQSLLNLSESQLWYIRQLFLHTTTQILLIICKTKQQSKQSSVIQLLLPRYLVLCTSDTVPNNRMVGGQGLSTIINQTDGCLIKIDDDFVLDPNELINSNDDNDETKQTDDEDNDDNDDKIKTSIIYTCKKLCNDNDRDVRESVKTINFLKNFYLTKTNNNQDSTTINNNMDTDEQQCHTCENQENQIPNITESSISTSSSTI